MPDSQWRVVKEDWPVKAKSSDVRITKEMIDKVFSKVPKRQDTK